MAGDIPDPAEVQAAFDRYLAEAAKPLEYADRTKPRPYDEWLTQQRARFEHLKTTIYSIHFELRKELPGTAGPVEQKQDLQNREKLNALLKRAQAFLWDEFQRLPKDLLATLEGHLGQKEISPSSARQIFEGYKALAFEYHDFVRDILRNIPQADLMRDPILGNYGSRDPVRADKLVRQRVAERVARADAAGRSSPLERAYLEYQLWARHRIPAMEAPRDVAGTGKALPVSRATLAEWIATRRTQVAALRGILLHATAQQRDALAFEVLKDLNVAYDLLADLLVNQGDSQALQALKMDQLGVLSAVRDLETARVRKGEVKITERMGALRDGLVNWYAHHGDVAQANLVKAQYAMGTNDYVAARRFFEEAKRELEKKPNDPRLAFVNQMLTPGTGGLDQSWPAYERRVVQAEQFAWITVLENVAEGYGRARMGKGVEGEEWRAAGRLTLLRELREVMTARYEKEEDRPRSFRSAMEVIRRRAAEEEAGAETTSFKPTKAAFEKGHPHYYQNLRLLASADDFFGKWIDREAFQSGESEQLLLEMARWAEGQGAKHVADVFRAPLLGKGHKESAVFIAARDDLAKLSPETVEMLCKEGMVGALFTILGALTGGAATGGATASLRNLGRFLTQRAGRAIWNAGEVTLQTRRYLRVAEFLELPALQRGVGFLSNVGAFTGTMRGINQARGIPNDLFWKDYARHFLMFASIPLGKAGFETGYSIFTAGRLAQREVGALLSPAARATLAVEAEALFGRSYAELTGAERILLALKRPGVVGAEAHTMMGIEDIEPFLNLIEQRPEHVGYLPRFLSTLQTIGILKAGGAAGEGVAREAGRAVKTARGALREGREAAQMRAEAAARGEEIPDLAGRPFAGALGEVGERGRAILDGAGKTFGTVLDVTAAPFGAASTVFMIFGPLLRFVPRPEPPTLAAHYSSRVNLGEEGYVRVVGIASEDAAKIGKPLAATKGPGDLHVTIVDHREIAEMSKTLLEAWLKEQEGNPDILQTPAQVKALADGLLREHLKAHPELAQKPMKPKDEEKLREKLLTPYLKDGARRFESRPRSPV